VNQLVGCYVAHERFKLDETDTPLNGMKYPFVLKTDLEKVTVAGKILLAGPVIFIPA